MMGEVLGRYENHVRIDENKVDAWDIPVLHVETKYTDNEFNMAKDAVEVGCAVAEAAGFEVLSKKRFPTRRATAFTRWEPAAWAMIRSRAS